MAVECASKVNIFKNVFSVLITTFFSQKYQKILSVRKIRNYDEERVFFSRKKTFSSFESPLHKNGKVQNIAVVDGRLVTYKLTLKL